MTRRNLELVLLCVAAPIVVLLFAMLAINQGQSLNATTLGVPIGIFVAFVIALPLLLLFLFAVVDLGRSVFLSMALDDAAHAVCEAASGHPAGDVAESQLREAAFAAAPALDRDDLHLDVSVRYGEFEDRPYEHRFYNERTDAYDERTSFARSRPVEVALVLEGAYLTPLGAGLSSGGEGSGRFAFRAQVRGAADATVEGGAW